MKTGTLFDQEKTGGRAEIRRKVPAYLGHKGEKEITAGLSYPPIR